MTDLTDQLDAIQAHLDYIRDPTGWTTVTERNARFLLALAWKQQAAIDAISKLAEQWNARGESDMKFSKTIPDEDIAMAILTDGAAKVENARHIRIALEAKP